jgi:hypothetical protein
MASGGAPQWSPGEPHPLSGPAMTPGDFNFAPPEYYQQHPNYDAQGADYARRGTEQMAAWHQAMMAGITNRGPQRQPAYATSQMGSPIDPALVSNTVNQLIGEMYPIGMGGMGGGGATGMGNAMGGLGSGLGSLPGYENFPRTPPGLLDAMRANPMGGSHGPAAWRA